MRHVYTVTSNDCGTVVRQVTVPARMVLRTGTVWFTHHFQLLHVCGATVIGLDQGSSLVKYGAHHQAQGEHVADNAAHGRRLHLRSCTDKTDTVHCTIAQAELHHNFPILAEFENSLMFSTDENKYDLESVLTFYFYFYDPT